MPHAATQTEAVDVNRDTAHAAACAEVVARMLRMVADPACSHSEMAHALLHEVRRGSGSLGAGSAR